MKYSAYTWLRLCLLLAPLGLPGQVPRFERVVEYGSPSWVRQVDMCLDSADNLYVAGIFEESVCFADTCLVADDQAHTNIYVISFDPQGQMRWARLIEGPSKDIVARLGVKQGQLVVSGFFSLEMPWGDTTLYARSSGVFWGELGLADGAWGQIHQIDGRRQEETQSMAITQDGQVWLGGFSDSDTLRAEGVTLVSDTSGTRDLWLAGYNAEGQLETFRLLTSAAEGWAGRVRHVAVDQVGNQYLEGAFEADLLIGQDTLWSTTNTWNQADNYLIKLSPQGEVIWAQVGRPIHQMVLDQQGRLIVTGEVGTAMTWGNHTIAPGYYLAALDETGEPEWLFQNSIMSNIFLVTGLAAKGNHIYTYSRYSGPLELPDTTYAGVPHDNFIFCHAANDGELLWHKKIGVGDVDESSGEILLDSRNRLVVSGAFHTEFQNYTYLDTIQVVDQYPFSGFGQWHYIGITGPDTLLSTNLYAQAELPPTWQAYPNPVRHTLYIEGDQAGQPVTLSLIDLRGRVWQRTSLLWPKARYSMGLSDLPAGIYFLHLQANTAQTVFKLIKQP